MTVIQRRDGLVVWQCRIGVTTGVMLVRGADLPMRRAVEAAFRSLTGKRSEFCFSGWGGKLSPSELEVVEKLAGLRRLAGRRVPGTCPSCGLVMSFREEDEQGVCNERGDAE